MAAASPRGHLPQSFEKSRTLYLSEVTRLIEQVAQGDADAFEALYRATSRAVLSECLRILRDRVEAEDARQEVYLRVWTKASTFQRSSKSPMSWLVAIARNRSFDQLRRARLRQLDYVADQEATVPDRHAGPEQLAILGSERDRLLRSLGELRPDLQEAVWRAHVLGESYEELANRFEVPLNTMRSWLYRSRQHLVKSLTD